MSSTNEVQGYCLRWNNHHEQLLTVLESLYQEGSFVDVTLASEGKSIQAHRLVLCACSPYFQVTQQPVLLHLLAGTSMALSW